MIYWRLLPSCRPRLLLFLCLHGSIEADSSTMRHRARASDAWMSRSRVRASSLSSEQPGPDHRVECAMRSVAFDMSQRFPAAQRHAAGIHGSLQLDECGMSRPMQKVEPAPCSDGRHWAACNHEKMIHTPTHVFFVDCERGHDDNNGSLTAPFATLQRAQIASRAAGPKSQVFLRAGTCYMVEPLRLTEEDSGISWSSFKDEQVVISAGAALVNLTWKPWSDKVLVADLPAEVNASAVDSLFETADGPAGPKARRLVRARFPNGNSEVDRMPTNYDKLGGGVSSVRAWEIAGNKSLRFPQVRRNSSFYPFFGHSLDSRWVIDYHVENASSYYRPERSFWQANIATAARYNASTFSQKVGSWTNVEDIAIHVIHYDWWGNWQWRLKEVNTSSQIMYFSEGGWQDAHGGPVAHNYFFVENVLEELDVEGEWYIDSKARKIYLFPHSDAGPPESWRLVVSQLPTVLQVAGSDTALISNVSFIGVTFAHATTTYLRERYTVPSAGDWSVLVRGAVEISNACGIEIRGCTFAQIGGNGVSLEGHVHDSVIADSDFLKIGDSGIVSVGKLADAAPYDGSNVQSFPSNVSIERCHFGQIGVFGKQTSALFVAVSKGIRFIDNVVYDGPRAGVNINDGFAGGHVLARNVIFNQLLESGDHGPVNTWSRTAYVQPRANEVTTIQEWSRIDSNFIMVGPKYGALYGPGTGACSNGVPDRNCPKNGGSMYTCLDHDDGSDFYLDTRNVCVFAGMKNYIGQNKIWDSNLIAYPEGAIRQNRSGMACVWTSMYIGGNQSGHPCSEPTGGTGVCHNQETFTNNTCVSHSQQPFEYDQFYLKDLLKYGSRNTTIPYTARNQHYLGSPFNFQGWNHSQSVAHGVDEGGYVHPEMETHELEQFARKLLGLPVPSSLASVASLPTMVTDDRLDRIANTALIDNGVFV